MSVQTYVPACFCCVCLCVFLCVCSRQWVSCENFARERMACSCIETAHWTHFNLLWVRTQMFNTSFMFYFSALNIEAHQQRGKTYVFLSYMVVALIHHGGPIELFLIPAFAPQDWCIKGLGMYHPVHGMLHIKEPLLLIGNSGPCGGSGYPLLLSEWSFTMCPTSYNHKQNVLSVSLNKPFWYPYLLSLFILKKKYG